MLSKKQKEFDILDNEPGWRYIPPRDEKEDAIKQAHEVFGRAKGRGCLPKNGRKDKQEASDATWIQNKKRAKNGGKNSTWYPEILDIAIKYGYSYAFDNLRQMAIKQCKDIFQRAKERGALPKQTDKNIQENDDANWIQHKKQTKQGKGTGFFYHEFLQISKDFGFPDAFEIINSECEDIEKCEQVFKRSKKRGFLPKCNSKNKQEINDAQWIARKINSKLGKGKSLWHHKFLQIAKEHGFADAFDNSKQTSINECIDIFKRAKKRNKLPKNGSKEMQEARDARWIQGRKQAKQGKGNCIFYSEFLEIATNHGFTDAFETVNHRTEVVEKCKEIFKRAKERGSLPQYNARDKKQKQDSKWIGHIKSAKQGKGKSIFYPELLKIVEEYGFPNAFEIRNLEEETICHSHEIFKRSVERGCLPKYESRNKQEEKDATWIGTKKKALINKRGNWYPELLHIAAQYGFPDAFETR